MPTLISGSAFKICCGSILGRRSARIGSGGGGGRNRGVDFVQKVNSTVNSTDRRGSDFRTGAPGSYVAFGLSIG